MNAKTHRFSTTVATAVTTLMLAAWPSNAPAAEVLRWQPLETTGKPHPRHEAAFVQCDGRFFLLGGRGIKPVDIFDPATGIWTTGAKPPVEIHHFQPVVWENRILVPGAMTGIYPRETALDRILIYDPELDQWSWGPEIPADRRRGGAGAVVYKHKLYLVCGIQNGHWDGWVPWLDAYDFKTGTWSKLPDAPRVRDHFMAAIVGDRLYAAGGRKTSGATRQVFDLTISEVDVCDLITRAWSTLPAPRGDLPTPRAGCSALVIGTDLLIAGGESRGQKVAHDEVHALNTTTGVWRSFSTLARGRHGTGIVQWNNTLYTCSGSGGRGGGPELDTTEILRLPVASAARADKTSVIVVNRNPQADFAAAELRRAVESNKSQGDWQISLRLETVDTADGIEPEGFRVERTPRGDAHQINIVAVDPAGLMYGGLEVAEIIRTLGIDQIKNDTQNPYMQMRGTKFNIPLDVRTPSYTDVCDAAQNNLPQMWSFDFWREYIDTLARYRYNYVSLWNLHPFPSLVRVPEYPDVALNDVWRSRVKWDEHYPLEGHEFVSGEILRDVEIIKRMTIEDKIEFWRKVMAYGKSRNVDFYFVTWNIFTYGTAGKYGITEDFRNKTTIDYFRQSVRQLLLTYPDLAGIGLTTGENMPGADFQEKEDWAMATYGQGVLDAVKDRPNRKITFIHRQHQAKAGDIARTFRPLIDNSSVDFIFSFKYAKAHVYSATTQPYHDAFVKDLGDLKTIWTLRNDDVYYFRWGAPDFVREFVKNIPYDVSRGYYYGSDQYIWGREFLQRDATQPRRLEIDKHWYQWMLWGRFAYDPDLENERLKAVVANRFGLSRKAGDRLFDAWQNASMVYPITTGFHWGALDFQWYIEGCQSRPGPANNDTGFHDVNRFISLKPHARSGCQSIAEYAKAPGQPPPNGMRTPLQVADLLDNHCQSALDMLSESPHERGRELQQTLADLRIIAALGAYYADKIRGATELAVFRNSKDDDNKDKAIGHLADAARHWHDFASLALAHHKNPLWTNRVGYVDWKKNYQHVLDDIRIAGGDPAKLDLPIAIDVPSVPVPRWVP